MASNIVETNGRGTEYAKLTCDYRYRFIDGDPPTKYVCSICTFVARQPQQTSCCGNIFCKNCLELLKYKCKNFTCPICRCNPLDYFNDRRVEREINALEIYCPNNKGEIMLPRDEESLSKLKNNENNNDICQWKGILKEIESHLQVCPFHIVPCTNKCGDLILRQELQYHLTKECRERVVNCRYCQEQGAYQVICNSHIETCPGYPVTCSNDGCKQIIKRHFMKNHRDICPKQLIPCRYNDIGCEVLMKREDQSKHDEIYMKMHLDMAVDVVRYFETAIEDIQEENDAYKALTLQLQTRLANITVPPKYGGLHLVLKLPFKKEDNDFVMMSPGFYSSPGGYKMSLHIYPNGNGTGKGTHISCFVCLMPGEYDDILEWPFRGEITVELLNQLQDSNHQRNVLKLDGFTSQNFCKRVVGKEYGQGYGFPTFIPQSELFCESSQMCQYFKDDTLYFRVSVMVTSMTKPWLANSTCMS